MASLTADNAKVHEVLDALLLRVQALEAAFMRSKHLLPRYDLQRHHSALKALATAIGARREELAPRKKFSFKRKEPAAKAVASTAKPSVEPSSSSQAAAGYTAVQPGAAAPSVPASGSG